MEEKSDNFFGRKNLAIIVAGIIVGTAVLCAFVYLQIENDRVVYLTVEADKNAFSSNENVTFHLVSLSRHREFELVDAGDGNEPSPTYGGINIWKVPDRVDLEALFDDPMIMWDYFDNRGEFYPFTGKVHFDRFSSEDGSLQVSWNGTVTTDDYSGESPRYNYHPATSGHYIIVPTQRYDFANEDYTFIIDQNAIFYYDSLDAGIEMANEPGENVTYELTMRAPPGTPGEMAGDLYATLAYPGDRFNVNDDIMLYLNETGIVLTGDADTLFNLSFNISILEQGNPGAVWPFTSLLDPEVYLDAVLVTVEGVYHFGMWVQWKGGMTYVFQY